MGLISVSLISDLSFSSFEFSSYAATSTEIDTTLLSSMIGGLTTCSGAGLVAADSLASYSSIYLVSNSIGDLNYK